MELLPPFQVNISFNVANLQAKRIAVFGKTGYGKSNLIKTLITLSHKASPKTAQLIFDVNGEYAFSNKQGNGSDIVKPVKFDVIENPELAVSLVTGKRRQRNASEAGYLEALADEDMHATVRSFWRCFCVQELGLAVAPFHKARFVAPTKYVEDKGWDKTQTYHLDDFAEAYDVITNSKYSKSDTVTQLKGKTGQFSFLRMYLKTQAELSPVMRR